MSRLSGPLSPDTSIVDRDPPEPCSQAQTGVWFAERLGGVGSSYHLALALRLRGRVDVAALTGALGDLVDRHPVLRSCFPERDGGPVRTPLGTGGWTLDRQALAGGPASDQERRLSVVLRERTTAPFDVERGPLFRATLVDLGAESAVLHLVVHHLVFDGLSRDLLADDLATLYSARVRGVTLPLPALPPYRRYVEWEAGQVARLDGPPPAGWAAVAPDGPEVPLSAVLSFPDGGGHRPAVPLRRTVDADVRAALDGLAAASGVTPFTVLLAAWAAVLERYGAAPVVSIPMNTRPPEFRGSVGLFVNEIPVRLPAVGAACFREYLAGTAERLRAVLPLRCLPVAALRQRVGRDPAGRAAWRAPGVLFGYRRGRAAPLDMAGLEVAYEPFLPSHGTRAELECQLVDDGTRITGRFEHHPGLDHALVGQLTDHWLDLLRALVTAPDRRPAAVPLSNRARQRSAGERPRVVRPGAGRLPTEGVTVASGATVPALFARQATLTPDAVAVWSEDGAWSYADVHRRAHRLAHRLRAAGVGAESLVAVCAERSLELVVGLLGVLEAGAAYVPLDPGYPAPRLAYMLRDSAPQALLTQAALLPVLGDHRVPTVLLDHLDPSDHPTDDPLPVVTGGNAAYALYTSGSTGAPKAAVISHGALHNRLRWMQDTYRLTPDDRVLQKTPAGFDVSVWEFFWPLTCGATLVLARPGGHRDSGYLVGLIRRARVSTVHFVPSMLRAFLDEPDVAACRSLRRVISSGEELPPDLVGRFFARLDAELHNLYGPTEATIDVSAWRCGPADAGHRVPIGRPIDNTRLYVLDPGLAPVPPGVAGELYIGGLPLARGYLRRPGMTAERFVPDPFGPPGGRLYRTGDRARYRPDGALEFLGRLDHQVKIRGHRVEPAEVEAVLRAHPGVREAVVVARTDATGDGHGAGGAGGGADPVLVGYVVPAGDGPPPEPAALQAAVRARLPDVMVPAAVVAVASFPLTANGKLDRGALPPPPRLQRPHQPPRTPAERAVAAVWAELFGLDRVGAHDDFFDLGGHSLLATRTLSRLRDALGVELSLRTLFDRPTVAGLAAALEQATADQAAGR